MKCWVARSASKTHVRIQFEPFEFAWPGWDLYEGEINEEDMLFLNTAYGPDAVVDIERIHQEVYLAAVAGGKRVEFPDFEIAGPSRDLR